MKIFSGIFGGLILACVLCFALSNRQQVQIGMWPLDGSLPMPLYMVGFAPLIFGLAFGGLWGWLCGLPHRLRARRLHKELGSMNEKLDALRHSAVIVPAPEAPGKWWEWKK